MSVHSRNIQWMEILLLGGEYLTKLLSGSKWDDLSRYALAHEVCQTRQHHDYQAIAHMSDLAGALSKARSCCTEWPLSVYYQSRSSETDPQRKAVPHIECISGHCVTENDGEDI